MVEKSFLSKNEHFGKHLFFPIEKVQNVSDHPNIQKNKLLLYEYLGNFRPYFLIFFMKMTFKPTHPSKVWKIPYFFFKPSLIGMEGVTWKN